MYWHVAGQGPFGHSMCPGVSCWGFVPFAWWSGIWSWHTRTRRVAIPYLWHARPQHSVFTVLIMTGEAANDDRGCTWRELCCSFTTFCACNNRPLNLSNVLFCLIFDALVTFLQLKRVQIKHCILYYPCWCVDQIMQPKHDDVVSNPYKVWCLQIKAVCGTCTGYYWENGKTTLHFCIALYTFPHPCL